MSPAGLEIVEAQEGEPRRQAFEIRRRVFVVEQDCPPEEEFDAHDADSHHYLATVEGEPAGAARWRVVGHEGVAAAKLERFAVLPAYRGRGVGRALVARLLEDARAAGHRRFLIHAQSHLESFYGAFGFERRGEELMEAGIPHVAMWREEASDSVRSIP